MFKASDTQGTLSNYLVDDGLQIWLNAFVIGRQAQGVSEGTLHFYKVKFKSFARYCDSKLISQVSQISPHLLREYLLHLEAAGHNPGGDHAHYRAVRSFLYWYEDEIEPDNWKNPIKKVKSPYQTGRAIRTSLNRYYSNTIGDMLWRVLH